MQSTSSSASFPAKCLGLFWKQPWSQQALVWIAPGRLLRAAVSRDAFLGRAHLAVLLVQGPTWTLAQGSRPWAPLLASAGGVLGPMGLPFNPMARYFHTKSCHKPQCFEEAVAVQWFKFHTGPHVAANAEKLCLGFTIFCLKSHVWNAGSQNECK